MATPGQSTKRTLVDYDAPNSELQDSKRQRITLDAGQKTTCIKALAASFYFFATQKGLPTNDLHVSAQVANVIRTAFNTRRQAINGSGSLSTHKDKELTVSHNGTKHEYNREALIKDLEELLKWFGLKMEKPKAEDRNHWWGTFLPYLSYCCAWSSRLKELRTGHGRFVISKKDGKEIEARVSDFRLKARHHVLLEGVTFSPESRASMSQSVGPMTTLISLAGESKRSSYGKKHRDAAMRAFSHIPNCSAIVEALEGTKAKESAPLIGALADLTLLVPARNQRRAFFPLCRFAYAALSKEEKKAYSHEWKDKKITKTPTKLIDTVMDQDGMEIYHLNCWDMSGKGAAMIYKTCHAAAEGWTMPKTSEMTSEIAGQSTFHAIWGTFCEDFSLLKWVTDKKQWMKRREMGGFMINYGSSTSTVKISLPELKHYSKLASSNLTSRMTDRNEQVASYPVWAGKRTQNYSQDLFDSLVESQKSDAAPIGKDINSLALEVMKETKKMMEELQTTKKLRMGTVDWYTMHGVTLEKGVDGTVAIAPELTGDFFLSRE